MADRNHGVADPSSRTSFWLLVAFLVVLFVAGGASRADVLGQAVVRAAAFGTLIIFIFRAEGLTWRPFAPVFALFGLIAVIVAAQLIPLPPAIWSSLPGHAIFLSAADASGQPQPWRPISIAPETTFNALASLVVPGVVLVLCANLSRAQHWLLARIVLGLIVAGSLMGLAQVSGVKLVNPLINYVPGSVSGNFANRNHFALFLAVGCVLAGVNIIYDQRIKLPLVLAGSLIVAFFGLLTLATGSRAGILLAGLAIAMVLALGSKALAAWLGSLPRPKAIAIVAGPLLAGVAMVVSLIALGRAEAVNRALTIDAGSDLRQKAAPYIVEATRDYFPVGSGFGTFDQAYRIVEPDDLLRLTYFNHAHNDWLEVALSGGIVGIAILFAVLAWYGHKVLGLWRARSPTGLAAAGAAILLLFMVASLADYPARTPMGMALVAISAVWLQRRWI